MDKMASLVLVLAAVAVPAGVSACSSQPGQTIVIVEQAEASAPVDAGVDAVSVVLDSGVEADASDAATDAGVVEAACEPAIDLPVDETCEVFYNDCSNSNQCGNTTSYICNIGMRPGTDGCNTMPNSPYPDAATQFCCRPTCLRDTQADIGCVNAGMGPRAYNCPRADAYNDDAGLTAPLPSPACTFHAHSGGDSRFNESVCCP